jgi:tRNA (guanine37-N1)-methyltransferase
MAPTLRIDVVTLFPEMISGFTAQGVLGRAIQRGLMQVETWNPREYTLDPHRCVDDRPYGGGPGMVMMVQPLREAAGGRARTIYMTPQGRRFDHEYARELAASDEPLLLVAGRYEGIDERLMQIEPGEELTIGDYVLSGGELAAAVVIDAVTRLVPGVLGDEESAVQDSFVGGLLDHPHYTRPREIDGLAVPEVLLGGNHEEIARWRRQEALARTMRRRPDLLTEKTGRTGSAGG